MKKVKSIMVLLIIIALLLIIPSVVNAADEYTYSDTEQGIEWSYELDDNGNVINLKCKTKSVTNSAVRIPSTIEGKTVISIGSNAFKSVTGITEVTIPNTIKEGSTSPCLDNPNITKITLEEGLTIVPQKLCANTGITEITIPNTVKEIGHSAFENCTNLKNVDLGNIETLGFKVFQGCTSLTEITIPNTLKNGATSPCLDNPNITKITLEEGLTIVPQKLCANTGITEITIPNTVTEIGYSAFENCTQLEKITILDNVTKIGPYEVDTNLNSRDLVFGNHNDNLTIYCYEDSVAAKYATKYNIKYEYLTKPSNPENPSNPSAEPDDTETPNDTDGKDDTTAPGKLPQTGVSIGVSLAIIVVIASGTFAYIRYKKLKGI